MPQRFIRLNRPRWVPWDRRWTHRWTSHPESGAQNSGGFDLRLEKLWRKAGTDLFQKHRRHRTIRGCLYSRTMRVASHETKKVSQEISRTRSQFPTTSFTFPQRLAVSVWLRRIWQSQQFYWQTSKVWWSHDYAREPQDCIIPIHKSIIPKTKLARKIWKHQKCWNLRILFSACPGVFILFRFPVLCLVRPGTLRPDLWSSCPLLVQGPPASHKMENFSPGFSDNQNINYMNT